MYKTFFMFLFLAFGTLLSAQETRLSANDKAPSFSVTDVLGRKQNLKALYKKEKVLLVFLRYAWCPVCNVRTHELIQQYDALKKKGYEVVVFYQSPAEAMKAYVEDKKIPFITISDPDRKYYQLYKLEYNGKKVMENITNDANTAATLTKSATIISEQERMKYATDKDNAEVGGTLIPGDFIINQKGRIEKLSYGKFLGDHLPLSEL